MKKLTSTLALFLTAFALTSWAAAPKGVTYKTSFALPTKNQLIEAHYGMNTLRTLPAPPHKKPPFDLYQEEIAALAKQGKLSLANAITIMELHSQHLTVAQFNAALSKLKVAPLVAKQVMGFYF